jgi:sugar lactone lactonase YvrE
MAQKPDWQIITDSRDKLGEGVLWNAAAGDLYWVDFYGPTLHRLSADRKRRDWTFRQFSNLGSLAFYEDGQLLLAFDRGVFLFDPRDSALAEFSDPNQQRIAIAYNDGKVDRTGHLWIGTFDVAEAAPRAILYRLDADGGWRIGDSGFIVCNGPAFSPTGDVLYFNDTIGHQTLAYDLDAASGHLSRRRVFHSFAGEDGMPDGLCVDSEGSVWCALYGGGKVVRLSPAGERLDTLLLPVPNVTACCLGGADLRTLFVTSGRTNEDAADNGGALFATSVDVAGLIEPTVTLSPGGA